MKTKKTRVAIIGSGPSGLLLSLLLEKQGVDNIIIERKNENHILQRIRAGVLEQGFANLIKEAGVSKNMETFGEIHNKVEFALNDERIELDLKKLTNNSVIVYGQVDITKDMFEERRKRSLESIYDANNVRLYGIESNKPYVTYEKDNIKYKVECDFIAGCDGYHGISRQSIPKNKRVEYKKLYPFSWLGLMSDTIPINNHLVYSKTNYGFALASMRSKTRSRYYMQVPSQSNLEDWSDEKFWDEFKKRMPSSLSKNLITGQSIEKSIVPIKSFICEPLQYGNLFLVGDAGHIVPPTGAKGLNLAASDVSTLYKVLTKFYRENDKTVINKYSEIALRRVWNGIRFSWWMTNLLHNFDNTDFDKKIKESEINYYLKSEAGQKIIAEQYVGLAYENLK